MGQMVSALSVDRESSRGEWCPTCRERLIVAVPGEIYIRTAILRVSGPTGEVTARCPRCKSWNEVPLRLAD
jgi:hypothetical protein